ncbi:FemAB family XrtA/PEP-CTERM system-associated protein [Gemmatimonas sp.]|uniref:FemAB family XrtA/PEP-CTERM system-associated protein n=1 Tax=Gemmatimonas sp. TaxID=1962908 RepID=UPI003DA5EA04
MALYIIRRHDDHWCCRANMSIKVEQVDASAMAAEWDAFVQLQLGWTHFHLCAWQSVVRTVWKHETLYLTARNDYGALCGVLPLVRVRSRLFGDFVCSMPFVSYGGPLGSTEAVRALAQWAVEYSDTQRVDLLELRSYVQLPLDMPVSHRKVTVVLDLPGSGSEALMKSFDAKVRSQVRRPFKEGMEVRFGPDQVEPFFAVFSEHMRDLGTPTQPLSLFRTLAETFPDSALFACAWINGEPVAAGCGFRWGSEFEITWASSLRSHSRLSPNMGLYFAFMERMQQEGVVLFNFGRCTPDSGTHRFKRQWGSRDVPLWWYNRARSAVRKTPSPDDSRYSMGPRVWRKLPVPVATRLGPMIVRFIP